jgi:hypothetical protein
VYHYLQSTTAHIERLVRSEFSVSHLLIVFSTTRVSHLPIRALSLTAWSQLRLQAGLVWGEVLQGGGGSGSLSVLVGGGTAISVSHLVPTLAIVDVRYSPLRRGPGV